MSNRDILRQGARWLGRKRWLRFGIRSRIARLLENPDLTRGDDFTQGFYGGSYCGNTSNFVDWTTRYFGAYAIEELEFYRDIHALFGDSAVVLDVGANVGHHALFYGLMGAEVLACEPNPTAFGLLLEKIHRNPGLRIRPLQIALSGQKHTLDLSIPEGCNLGMASFERKVGARSIPVECVPGDQLGHIRSVTRLDFIKIDVEGHEKEVLSGLEKTIRAFQPVVFFERMDKQDDFRNIRRLLPDGYAFYDFFDDQHFGLLFSQPGYRLKVLRPSDQPEADNIVACPANLIAKLEQCIGELGRVVGH